MGDNARLPTVELLEGVSNYNNWKFAMRMWLIHEDLWTCIKTELNSEGEPVEQSNTKLQKALAKICLFVKPCCYAHVREARTPKEAWNNLQKAYEDKGLIRRLGLLRILFNTKLDNSKNMENYVSKIISTAQQIADISKPIEDEFIAVLMLNGLPNSFDPMVMALENSGIDLTSELVKAKLLQEDIRTEVSECGNPADSALAIKGTKKNNKFTFKCFKCHKTGHKASECHNYRSENKNKNNSKKRNSEDWCLFTAMTMKNATWYVDSACTDHMTGSKDCLVNFQNDTSLEISMANNQKVQSKGKGDTFTKVKNKEIKISDVIYVPGLGLNLLSVHQMIKKGLIIIFSENGCDFYDKDKCYIKGTIKAHASCLGGLYRLDAGSDHMARSAIENHQSESASSDLKRNDEELWHRRLGHLNRKSMRLLKDGMADGIQFKGNGKTCITCIKGKQTRTPFSRNMVGSRAKKTMELVHSDLCGPMSVSSHGGARYLFMITDDFSRKSFGYFLKHKNEAFAKFKEWKTFAENETGNRLQAIRTDNGTEYLNNEFTNFLKVHGIKHQKSAPYTPEQNGVAERANRTVIEKTRTLLEDANLDKQYWAEAANTAIYLKNRSPTKAVRFKTPEEAWSKKKVNLKHLKIFGCTAYAHVPKQLRNKLDPKSKQLIFVGYSTDSKAYRLIDSKNPSKIIISRDVIFIEENTNKSVKQKETKIDIQYQVLNNELESNTESSNQNLIEEKEGEDEGDHAKKKPRYPIRERKPKEFPDYVVYNACSERKVPHSVEEAMACDDVESWKAAMKDEYLSFKENDAWTLVDLPPDLKPVKCKWIFKIKKDKRNVNQYKARLVAKGFTQRYGIDYTETFSPVVRNSTIRMLLALSVELDLEISHLDVSTAFLNGELKETIYMEQPEGFVVKGKEDKVCLLKRAVYGLKQSSRTWNEKVNDTLLSLDFIRSKTEPCVYFRNKNKNIFIIAIYVDDFLLFSNDKEEEAHIKGELMSTFKMKDLGDAQQVLGMRIRRKKNELLLDQTQYIDKILERFNMSDAKPCATPAEPGISLLKANKEDDSYPYRELTGCLMYLAMTCRPDIGHIASVLSQYNNCYTDEHWKASKRVLRYLKGTKNLCLCYSKGNTNLIGYVDADWANDKQDRRSYTGLVFKLGGSTITWESRKQQTVALSSTEAEYLALSDGAKEGKYIKALLLELIGKNEPVVIYNDNQSAQKLSENHILNKRTKHIDIRYHFVREAVEEGSILLRYLPTEDMIADIMTKSLSGPKHTKYLTLLGLKYEDAGCIKGE